MQFKGIEALAANQPGNSSRRNRFTDKYIK